MNIKEFKNRLDSIYEHLKDYERESVTLGIKVERIGSVCGTSIVDISSIHAGCDWDKNKIIIYATETLREIDRDEIKSLHDKYDELSWKKYQIDNLKKENKKLQKLLQKTKS